MNKPIQPITVKLRDRVTFDTDEGIQAGYVNGLRRDLGNGELHAWVEVDHLLPGGFRAVPVSDILTSNHIGPPSALHLDWANLSLRAVIPDATNDTARRLARAERALQRAGFKDIDGQEWRPPIGPAPIFIIDGEEVANAYQSGLADAHSAREGFADFLIRELGPQALADGTISIIDAAEKAWHAGHAAKAPAKSATE